MRLSTCLIRCIAGARPFERLKLGGCIWEENIRLIIDKTSLKSGEIFSHLTAGWLAGILRSPVFEAVCDEFPLGHLVEPVKSPSGVLTAVESRESINTSLQFRGKSKHTRLLERPRTTAKYLRKQKKRLTTLCSLLD